MSKFYIRKFAYQVQDLEWTEDALHSHSRDDLTGFLSCISVKVHFISHKS